MKRGMKIYRQPRDLLSKRREAQEVELPQAKECCSFGGIFSMEHPELSAGRLKSKIGNLEATESPNLVVIDAGCLTHVAEILNQR